MEKKFDKCEICGSPLIYSTSEEGYKSLPCEFCGNIFNTNIYCDKGHYICNECHMKGPLEIIEKTCEQTDLKDPFILADKIMKHPKFKVYGPEHHALVPAVILTALKNNNIKKPNSDNITIKDIKEGIKRGSKIPGGYCGFYGACGAGIGAGIATSIFTGGTPSENIPRSLANEATSRTLEKIADNLEHCCKRSVRLSICETLKFFKEKFNINLDYSPFRCPFSEINPKCEGENCPIY